MLLNGCQKEISDENNSIFNGILNTDNFGNCFPIDVFGVYIKNTPISDTNGVVMQVNVTSPGSYSIKSDTVHGIWFSNSSTTSQMGNQTIRLKARGTPDTTGNINFTVTLGNNSCKFTINVLPPSTTQAKYTFITSGTQCSVTNLSGNYIVGTSMNSSNSVSLGINATIGGYYSLTCSANGVIFSSTGILVPGNQSIILNATGTPTSAGIHTYDVTNGNSSCSFPVTYSALPQQIDTVFICGYDATSAFGPFTPKFWKAGILQTLTPNYGNAKMWGITAIANDIYIAGSFVSTNFKNAIVWKNGGATQISDGTSDAEALCISTDGLDIYCGGYQDNNSTFSTNPVFWKNSARNILPTSSTSASVHAISNTSNNIYFGGTMNSEPVAWLNNTYYSINPITGIQGCINDIFISGTDVYMVGYIVDQLTGSERAIIWKNGNFTILSPGEPCIAKSVFVSGGDIYVTGFQWTSTSTSKLKMWKNGIATNITNGTNSVIGNDIFIKGNDIYIAGNEDGKITYWKNGTATYLTNGSNWGEATGIFVK